jgi:hypothetical protein
MVPYVQQKSSGLKFPMSRTGSHVTYSCRHNSSCFTFPIFVHSWRFSVFHSLQSTQLSSSASTDGCCERVVVCRTQRYPSALTCDDNSLWKQTKLVQVPVTAYNFFFLNMFCTHNYAVTYPLFNYTFQKLSLLHWQG